MIFHLLSDLHLEYNPFILNKPQNADALILAGDIGNPSTNDYNDLIKQASHLYKYVFVIKGNHECYRLTIQQTDDKISKITNEYNNVFYLQKNYIDIENNIRVCGVTLWSNILESQKSDINCFNADFKNINEWSVEKNNYEHYKDVEFIKTQIQYAKQDNKKLIVITHHAAREELILFNKVL